MNVEQLQEIKDRVEKTTPGPWYWNGEYKSGVGSTLDSKGDIADFWKDGKSGIDAQFVAYAREDVPALIAEVERLQNIIISERRESLINTYESIGAEDEKIKKLRKALEIILEEEGPNCDGYETLIHATARQALEGTK